MGRETRSFVAWMFDPWSVWMSFLSLFQSSIFRALSAFQFTWDHIHLTTKRPTTRGLIGAPDRHQQVMDGYLTPGLQSS